MARIRSIKPEFCTSEQLAECSTSARLLFVLMWLHCDDQGIHPARPRQLKMECFPADPFTVEQVTEWVEELISAGLLLAYDAEDGQQYWLVTGWKHQRIDRPTNRYPPPPKGRRELAEPSPNARGGGDEDSTRTRRALALESTGGERRGEEGREREGGGRSPNGSRLADDWTLPDDWRTWATEQGMARREVERQADVFADYWRAKAGKDARKTDWLATWRNWVRRAMQGGPGNVGGASRPQRDGPPPVPMFPGLGGR